MFSFCGDLCSDFVGDLRAGIMLDGVTTCSYIRRLVYPFRQAEPYMRGMSYGSYYQGAMNPRQSSYGWGYDDDANSFMATNDYSNMWVIMSLHI